MCFATLTPPLIFWGFWLILVFVVVGLFVFLLLFPRVERFVLSCIDSSFYQFDSSQIDPSRFVLVRLQLKGKNPSFLLLPADCQRLAWEKKMHRLGCLWCKCFYFLERVFVKCFVILCFYDLKNGTISFKIVGLTFCYLLGRWSYDFVTFSQLEPSWW